MSRHILLSAAAGLTAALAGAPLGALHAQITQLPSNKPPTQVASDTAFIREARAGNLLEVLLGTQAGKKASNSAVKEFAQRMVTDHTALGNQWAALAPKSGPIVQSPLSSDQRAQVTRLDGLKGADYDREFMNTMLQDHQSDVATFQQISASAQSPAVRQLAASTLVTIQQHLTLAQQVGGQVGANTAVVTNPAAPPPTQPGQVVTRPGQVNRQPSNAAARGLEGDKQYVNEVSQGHLMEVELAQRARNQATDPKVRQFADRMLADFNKFKDRWTKLAADVGITNVHLGPLHKEKVDRLEKTPRGQVDRVYLDIVRENLASMVPYFQKEGRAAQSSEVRNLVNDELPTLQQHLSRAEDLGRQLHASGKVTGRNRAVSSNR